MSAEAVDVVVVGAGAAGMAAAAQAATAGCSVTVVDSYAAPGGQYHRRAAPRLDRRTPGSQAGTEGPVAAFAALAARGAVRVLHGTTIWTATVEGGPAPFRLHLGDGAGATDRAASLRARCVVVATGATDRVLPFPGWDLPGVFTAGGAQALLKGQGVRVGQRVVVGGSGPFLLPVAAGLAGVGSDVLEVVEAQPLAALVTRAPLGWANRAKLREAVGYATALARHRVPFRPRSAVTRVAGDGQVEQVTVSRLGPDWAPLPGTERTLAVDAVCVSFGFVPQIGLAPLLGCGVATDPVWGDHVITTDDDQATTAPGVYAAGEVTGVTGSDGAAVEGAIAGLAAAAALGRIDAGQLHVRSAGLRRQRAQHRRFATALGSMYARGTGWLDWLRGDTVICRCEEVELGTVRRAVTDLVATDLRSVKLTTRCGMGYCQGRMCGDAVAAILTRQSGAPPADAGALSTPPLLTPTPLAGIAALADQDAEEPTAPAQPDG